MKKSVGLVNCRHDQMRQKEGKRIKHTFLITGIWSLIRMSHKWNVRFLYFIELAQRSNKTLLSVNINRKSNQNINVETAKAPHFSVNTNNMKSNPDDYTCFYYFISLSVSFFLNTQFSSLLSVQGFWIIYPGYEKGIRCVQDPIQTVWGNIHKRM